MPLRRPAPQASPFGIKIADVVSFLKNDCRLDLGFEAQTLGIGARSATTTALIIYVLGQLTRLSDQDRHFYLEELNHFKSKGRHPDTYGTIHPTSWTTMQVALAAIQLRADISFVKRIVDNAINLYQLASGAWCLSGEDDEKLLYAIYPTIVLSRAISQLGLDYTTSMRKTIEYLNDYVPQNETEKLILTGLSTIISKILRSKGITLTDIIHLYDINYYKLIEAEFGQYGVTEYTIYPFSMKVYTPALYLLARQFMSPTHPFCIYLIKYIVVSIVDGKSWRHVAHDSPKKPCTFCTALAALTIFIARRDFNKFRNSYKIITDNRVNLKDVQLMVMTATTPVRVFVSYSSADESITTIAAKRLEHLGFNVIYAEFDLMVGDSVPGFINTALEEMDYFVIFLSPDSVSSRFVRDEFEGAKASEWQNKRVVILPALLRDCKIPPILAAKKWADFRVSMDHGINQLVSAIRKHNAKRK